MKPAWKYLLPISILLSCISSKLFSQAPANFNFELSSPGQYLTANAVLGWTVQTGYNSLSYGGINCNPNPLSNIWTPGSSEFSIVSTPIIGNSTLTPPSIDNQNVPHSPLGGTKVARLNNSQSSNPNITRLSTQFTVSPSLTLLQFAFAASFDAHHVCCEGASMRVDIYSCSSATPIPGLSSQLTPNCPFVNGYTTLFNTIVWTNWQVISKDLTPYIGQCLKLVVTVSDCALAGHHGTAYFDAGLTGQLIGNGLGLGIGPVGQGTSVNFCLGSNQAILSAPLGYSNYLWIAPGNFTIPHTFSTFTVTNPVIGSSYTCIATVNGISTVIPFTISPSQVNIVGLGSANSCLGGSSGSASVVANGSGTGYNYVWLNSNSVTVSSASFATGLSPGIYSVIVSSTTGSACGIASSTVSIGSQTSNAVQTVYKPYCSNEAFMCAGAGSNFHWYNGTVAIAAPLGTAQCYTLNNPSNGNFVHLTYSSAFGCQDSIKFILGSSAPGSTSILSSTYACQGSANGSVVINLSPAPGAQGGQNTFSVFSTGTLNPVYSASLVAGFQNSLGLSNLPASTYSVSAFDGSCKYTNTFSIVNFPDNFTLFQGSSNICPGGAMAAGVSFTSPPSPGQYTYSWSPTTWLPGNNGTFQSTIITPNLAPGTMSTIVYTVVVTPSVINCPLSKTISVTAFGSAIQATISHIPLLCKNSGLYTLSVNPPGGQFVFANSVASSSPVLNPNNFNPGTYSVNYSIGNPACVTGTQSFQISGPNLNVSGNLNICKGNTSTLSANGADSYTWSTGALSNSIVVSPTIHTTYSVTASHSLDACTNFSTVQVYVFPTPTVQVSGNTNVCLFQSTTLTANGANSFTWSTGSLINSINVTPTFSSIITVTGSSAPLNCAGQHSVLIQIIPGPPLQISGPTLVCEGQAFSLMASGANSYTWFASTSTWTNANNGSTLSLSQAGTNTYSLNASSNNSVCNSFTTITVYTMPCLGLDDNSEFSTLFKIYPNPGSGLFFIESTEDTEIEAFNSLGQMVFRKTILTGKQSIDLSEQAAGLYFISCKTNGISSVVRLVKLD